MKIETKYNIGDNVWFLDTEAKPLPKAKEMNILSIRVWHNQDNTIIYYNGYETENWEQIPERLREIHIFSSRQELLNSL